MPPYNPLKRLKEARIRADLSQRELGDKLGLDSGGGRVSQWEGGHKRPTREQLEDIAHMLGTSYEWLAEEMSPPGQPGRPRTKPVKPAKLVKTPKPAKTSSKQPKSPKSSKPGKGAPPKSPQTSGKGAGSASQVQGRRSGAGAGARSSGGGSGGSTGGSVAAGGSAVIQTPSREPRPGKKAKAAPKKANLSQSTERRAYALSLSQEIAQLKEDALEMAGRLGQLAETVARYERLAEALKELG